MKPKQAGIWMDHSHAYLIEFAGESSEPRLIESPLHSKGKGEFHGENHMHLKEQQELGSYYKQLMGIMEGYREVLLFGPTEAKTELYNLVPADHRFLIEIKQSDKLTPGQLQAFVRYHFLTK